MLRRNCRSFVGVILNVYVGLVIMNLYYSETIIITSVMAGCCCRDFHNMTLIIDGEISHGIKSLVESLLLLKIIVCGVIIACCIMVS